MRPAYQAAGTIGNACHKAEQADAPAKILVEHLPIGADNNAPSDPAAETMPSTLERTRSDTTRAATDIAIAAEVQAGDTPIRTPAPKMMLRKDARSPSACAPRDSDSAAHHDGAEAPAHREAARERLQQFPGKILHGNRQRELGDGNPDITRQGLQENAERLTEPRAEVEHRGGADQDGKRGREVLSGPLLFSLLVKTRGKPICVNMTKVETSGMKGRILRAADRPFYLQGIRAIGIDTIAAATGISKRTLYNPSSPRRH